VLTCLHVYLPTILMPRQLFTAEDIRRLARERMETLVLAPDDIVTHEAQDVAFALGVKMIRETESASSLRKDTLSSIQQNLPPLKVVKMANVQMEQFLEGKTTPGTNVWLKDVVVMAPNHPIVIRQIAKLQF